MANDPDKDDADGLDDIVSGSLQTRLALMQNLRDYMGGQQREPGFAIPVLPLAPAALKQPALAGMRAIWLGHSTVLIEIVGPWRFTRWVNAA